MLCDVRGGTVLTYMWCLHTSFQSCIFQQIVNTQINLPNTELFNVLFVQSYVPIILWQPNDLIRTNNSILSKVI